MSNKPKNNFNLEENPQKTRVCNKTMRFATLVETTRFRLFLVSFLKVANLFKLA